MSEFIIKFWGVRGSYPVCGSEFQKYGGNTTCISMEIGKKLLIFDAGTGIIKLGKEIIKDKERKDINLFFTHTHNDHIQGIMFFEPIYLSKYKLNIYGAELLNEGIEERVKKYMSHNYFPIKFEESGSVKRIKNIREENIIILNENENKIVNSSQITENKDENSIVIKIMHAVNHPVGGVTVYRVEYKGKSVVFATDIEGYYEGDLKLINFAKNADVLIHDCAYLNEEYEKKQGWGHSIPKMAAVNAKMAGVKKLIITHHSPEETEEKSEKKLAQSKEIFNETVLACEKMEITL